MIKPSERAQRFATPVFSVVAGAVLFGAAASAGNPGLGIGMAAIMSGYAVLLVVFGRRSETVALLGGDAVDERRRMIALRATEISAYMLISAILGAFVWEVAHGRDGSPYTQLGAISGVSFLVSTAVLRYRS
jgi:hypothetical protein